MGWLKLTETAELRHLVRFFHFLLLQTPPTLFGVQKKAKSLVNFGCRAGTPTYCTPTPLLVTRAIY